MYLKFQEYIPQSEHPNLQTTLTTCTHTDFSFSEQSMFSGCLFFKSKFFKNIFFKWKFSNLKLFTLMCTCAFNLLSLPTLALELSAKTGSNAGSITSFDIKMNKNKQAKQLKMMVKNMCLVPGVMCDHYNNFTTEYTSYPDRYVFWVTLRKCLKRTLEVSNNTDFKSSEIEFFQPTVQHIRQNSFQWTNDHGASDRYFTNCLSGCDLGYFRTGQSECEKFSNINNNSTYSAFKKFGPAPKFGHF